MADDNSYQANQDVIAGARAIRSNPAALAQLVALLNPPPPASPRADPAGALATRSSVPNMSDAMAGSAMMPGGGPLGSAPSTSSVRALTNALASALMPPVRPANLGATAALPPGAVDPSIAARVSAIADPATYSPNPPSPAFPTAPARPFPPPPGRPATSAPQPSVGPDPWMAGATAPAYAADPGAALRAVIYRQLNPTGSPIGVPPSAMANPPSTGAAPAPAAAWQPPATDRLVPTDEQPAPGGWQSAPVVANAPRLVPTDEMPAAKGGWQPPATDRIVGSNPFDAVHPPRSARWQNAPVVGAPVAKPNFFDDLVPATPINVQGPNGAVVSFPDGTDPATVDQVMRQNFSGPQQGDASQWGPLQEGVNSFMFGAGPAVNEWLGKNAPTWMLSGAQPTTASQEQANRDAYAAQNPGTTFAADVAGGSLPFLATGGAASGLGLAGRMGVAGLTGAVGQGGSDYVQGKPASTIATDAAVTGALGGVGEGVGTAIGNAAGGIAKKFAASDFTKTNPAGMTANAADKLTAALASQGQTPQGAIDAAKNLGPGATLADVGPATQNLASRLAAQEPTVAPVIAENLKARAEQFTPRINRAVDDALGPDFNAPTKMAALKVATRLNGSAYGPILNSGATVDVTPVRDMIANARVDPILAGVKEDPISSALAKAQSLVVGSNPAALPINVAHQAQSAIGDMADSAARSGNNAEARALTGVRSALLDQMPDAYNAARKQYATDKSVEEAFTEGRSLFASRSDGQMFDPDLLRARIDGMSQPEQDAYRMGARKAVSDVMGQSRSDPAGLQTKLANPDGYAVGKLSTVFGEQPTNALLSELDKVKGFQATNNLALSGSKTAMASSADEFMPTAKTMGGGVGGHGMLGSLPPWAVGIGGGALAGREVGEVFGQPHVGMALGAAGGAARSVAAPFVNASRLAAQGADRAAQARVLTSSPEQAIADALARRAATRQGAVGPNAKALARALAAAAAARSPSILSNPPPGLNPTDMLGN